jgi:beta-lactamase regulating signal transducer with metallopeptidase domain
MREARMNECVAKLFLSVAAVTFFSAPFYLFSRYVEKRSKLPVNTISLIWSMFLVFLGLAFLVRIFSGFSGPVVIPLGVSFEINEPVTHEYSLSPEVLLHHDINPLNAVSYIYCMGAIGSVAFFLFPFIISIFGKKKNKYRAGKRIEQLVSKAARAIDFRGTIGVFITSNNVSPYVPFGRSDSIVLPRKILRRSDDLIFKVLLHEAMHIKRRDPLLYFIGFVIRSLFWINPFAHAGVARWRHTREMMCDMAVKTNSRSVIDYAEYLLELCSVGKVMQRTDVTVSGDNLEERIMNILHVRKAKRIPLSFLFVMTVLFTLATVVTVARSATVPDMAPVDEPFKISSSFGERIFQGEKQFHSGIDIAVPRGRSVSSTASGIVSYAGYDEQMGNMIRIDHEGAMETVYAKLSDMVVKEGDVVVRGQYIGHSGKTGIATGPHLHYEVRINGKPVDPFPYFGQKK